MFDPLEKIAAEVREAEEDLRRIAREHGEMVEAHWTTGTSINMKWVRDVCIAALPKETN